MAFIVENIDALIMVMVGIGLLVTHRQIKDRYPQRVPYVRRVAIGLVAIGILLIMISPFSNSQQVVQATDNGVASATFPGKPTRRLVPASETPDGTDRETYDYKLPGHDVNYKLSRSTMTGDLLAMADTQRIDAIVAHFQSQNFVISNRTSSESNGIRVHSFQFAPPDIEAISTLRIAFAGDQIYRVIATTGKGEATPPEFQPFLASFTVRSTAK